MIKLIKSESMTLTPRMAEQWIRESPYEHQRALRNWRVDELTEYLKEGQFIPGAEVAFCRFNGSLKNTNGQHVMQAVIKSQIPAEIVRKDYRADTKDDLAMLFYRTDGILPRGPKYAFDSLELDLKFGIQKWQVGLISTGTRMIFKHLAGEKLGPGMYKFNNDLRVKFLHIWAPEYGKRWFAATAPAWSGPIAKIFKRQAMVAAGLWTLRLEPDKAMSFWAKLAADDGLKKGSPQRALLNWQREHPVGGGSGVRGIHAVPPHYHLKSINMAWNAYCEDRSIDYIKIYHASANQFDFIKYKA